MDIKNSVAFVTGANRGLGLELVKQLQARGAAKIYAGVRDVHSINLPGVIPVQFDVTNPADIAAAAAHCADTTLLINNAGIAKLVGFLAEDSIEVTREIFEANVYGPLRAAKAFAPALGKNGGGAIVNILSIASWTNSGQMGPYAMSKAAAWSLTNGLRNDLIPQGTQLVGVHVGFMDTDLTKGFDVAKVSAADVAGQILDGVQAGVKEVLADEITRKVKRGLSDEPGIYLAPLQR
ncbi:MULTISPECIES: SDR family oxidoreductase [unclassified Janthinobacterium]|uniref:SDR family oxidoreductase n=1 Tax=unclassified Janthinobacterium TaxID=2610881 RepID=UPI00162243DC|nr:MULTISPECIES: SDR family oxidoreductase [unclassified Janthinobacterium]MBB5369970.1 NAD(P)-dependent dehydrogenase (short-subunit alcohol dehydrogenase family) [Janthinobacterium sp. K2C7]MBB5382776.1 NAD(P)-dependent dehydrogenase (short-subunit alcohol dehydrogenase family) [Janthinobacterium sp. K2Li3]MBB5384761.1 NAD(P)-dependent dehydrogenase (short-subunit alcohol dehydrogenase family) [Janthinobacterium sp. K2E3]